MYTPKSYLKKSAFYFFALAMIGLMTFGPWTPIFVSIPRTEFVRNQLTQLVMPTIATEVPATIFGRIKNFATEKVAAPVAKEGLVPIGQIMIGAGIALFMTTAAFFLTVLLFWNMFLATLASMFGSRTRRGGDE